MSALDFLVVVFIGLVVGLLADTFIPGRMLFGWLVAAILAVVGSAVGGLLFEGIGPIDWAVGEVAILPAILGAILPVLVVKAIVALVRRRPT